jgi:hypothetical protein
MSASAKRPHWSESVLAVGFIYILWILPAMLGAILNWSVWIVYILILPGLIWYLAKEGARYYKDLKLSEQRAPLATRVPALGVLGYWFVITVWGEISGDTRFCGLFVAVGFVIMDLWSYGRVKDRRGRLGA